MYPPIVSRCCVKFSSSSLKKLATVWGCVSRVQLRSGRARNQERRRIRGRWESHRNTRYVPRDGEAPPEFHQCDGAKSEMDRAFPWKVQQPTRALQQSHKADLQVATRHHCVHSV